MHIFINIYYKYRQKLLPIFARTIIGNNYHRCFQEHRWKLPVKHVLTWIFINVFSRGRWSFEILSMFLKYWCNFHWYFLKKTSVSASVMISLSVFSGDISESLSTYSTQEQCSSFTFGLSLSLSFHWFLASSNVHRIDHASL